jgi:hypothetical protein
MDRTFTNLVVGNLDAASRQISGVESNRAVMYNFSSNSTQLQFTIGGYVASGAQVQMCTNLTDGVWQTVATYGVSTNAAVFTTNIVLQTASRFYRVQ